jgi:hypothetical protein
MYLLSVFIVVVDDVSPIEFRDVIELVVLIVD